MSTKTSGPRGPRQYREVVRTADLRGGEKRQRSGGKMVRLSAGPEAVPVEAAESMGYRFPRTEDSPERRRRLRSLFVDCIRGTMVGMLFRDETVDLMGDVFNLGPSRAKEVIGAARSGRNAWARFAVEVLEGMASGALACVAKTPRTADNRRFFARIAGYDLGDYRIDFGRDPGESRFVQLHAAFVLEHMEWARRK